MDELIAQFAFEGRELVQQASDDLLALETVPSDRARLESAFRAVHTLKGSVGLFDFGPMLTVLHRSEDLLSQARSGQIAVDAALIEPLLAVISWVDDSIDGISQAGELPEIQAQQASRLLGILQADIQPRDTDALAGRSQAVPEWASKARGRVAPGEADKAVVAIRYEPHPDCYFNGDDPLATIARVPGLLHLAVNLRDGTRALSDYDPFRCKLLIEAVSSGSLSEAEAIFRLIPDQVSIVPLSVGRPTPDSPAETERASPTQRSTMRVDADRIDKLIEIAGELVTAKNSLMGLADEARGQGQTSLARRIVSSNHEIEQLVGSLYGAVTRARMIPLEQTFRRFPRLVRETSRKLGKSLDLVIEGETVEADREIVESLFEPLLHLIRNSLDHGIEDEAERSQSSKPAKGRIRLGARQRGDRIEIEVADDGRGIDTARVGEIAIDRGIIDADQISQLSSAEISQLVFAPGFSTTSTVSDLSGRGVGLDAVLRSIQRLGGTLDMQSYAGTGTTFVLSLPVSFSMTQLMVVEVGAERYGIPITDVIETHKIPARAIQDIRAGQAFVLRGRTIPLLYLRDVLALPVSKSGADDVKVLVVQAGQDRIGLAVDSIGERAETVTRPLVGLLQGVPGVAGTTLLGDGKILLVLDVEELLS